MYCIQSWCRSQNNKTFSFVDTFCYQQLLIIERLHWMSFSILFSKIINRMTFSSFLNCFDNIDCTYLQLQCNNENRDILWLNCETSAKCSSILQVDLWTRCLTNLITHKLKDGLIEILVPNLHLSLLRLHCVGQLRLHLQQLSQCFVPFRETEWLQ